MGGYKYGNQVGGGGSVKKVNGNMPDSAGNVTIPVPVVDTSKLATKTELSAVASGSPKGTYASLAALQTAFPTGNANIYLVLGNSGVNEVDTLTVTAIPTTLNNVVVTLNGVAKNIPVDPATDTTTALVATKIRNATFTGWTTGGTGATVTFTKNTTGTNTAPTFSGGTTGVTATIVVTTAGVNTRTSDWHYWNGSAWTSGGVYQSSGIADKGITTEKIDDNAVILPKIDSTVYDKSYGYNLNLNRTSTAENFIVAYDLNAPGLNAVDLNIKFDTFITRITNSTNVQLFYNRLNSTTWSATGRITGKMSNATDGLRITEDISMTSATTAAGSFLLVLYVVTKPSNANVLLDIAHTKMIVNSVELAPASVSVIGGTPTITEKIYQDTALVTQKRLADDYDNRAINKFFNGNIFTFGDSITAGTEGGFVQYIESALGANISNYGSSGAPTGRLVGIMTHIKDRDNYSPTTTPDYTNTDAITIMIGTNGGVTGTLSGIPYTPGLSVDKLPFDVGGVTITTEDAYWALFPNNFYGNVALCIEYAMFKNPNMKVYLITPPHSDRGNWTQLPLVRNAMIEIGKLYSVPVIDAQENAGIDKKHLHKYSYDLTHLNTLGNELWGKYVAYQMLSN